MILCDQTRTEPCHPGNFGRNYPGPMVKNDSTMDPGAGAGMTRYGCIEKTGKKP